MNFILRKGYGLEWGGKRLSTNFKYLLPRLTAGASLLDVLRSENQRTLCFLCRFTVGGVGL